MRAIYILLLFVFLLSGCASVSNDNVASTQQVVVIPENITPVQLNEDSRVYIPELSGQWTISDTAPDFLVAERAYKREYNLEKQGKKIDKDKLFELVRKQLQNEELFIYNALSHAYLTIDLVRIKDGDRPPGEKVVRQSAVYGVQSLQSEGGVVDVSSSVNDTLLGGVAHATRFSASYRQFDKPVEFRGIIGFQGRYWLFLYYTDFLKDSGDLALIEPLLKSMVFEFN